MAHDSGGIRALRRGDPCVSAVSRERRSGGRRDPVVCRAAVELPAEKSDPGLRGAPRHSARRDARSIHGPASRCRRRHSPLHGIVRIDPALHPPREPSAMSEVRDSTELSTRRRRTEQRTENGSWQTVTFERITKTDSGSRAWMATPALLMSEAPRRSSPRLDAIWHASAVWSTASLAWTALSRSRTPTGTTPSVPKDDRRPYSSAWRNHAPSRGVRIVVK